MRTDFKFFSLALCVCTLGACSDDDSDSTGTGSSGSSDKQYVVMSGSGENNGAYLQTTDDPTTGKNYLIGMSDQATDYDHYERVKFIELNSFGAAVVDGIIDCDDMSKEPQSQMEGETWGVGDIAEFGDYVLLSYSTKHLVKDGASGAKAKATYSTDLANNLYLGVYEFDPTDADKEYLKYQNMIVRKSEDHVGEEAGQIKGNLRSRTETGIEVTGHYMWKCFYIGGNKFCLQLYTEKGTAGFVEGSHKAFGIFDVKTEQYTPVTGLPDADLIYDIALAYAADTDNNTITFEVETTDSQLPALYTIGKDGVAKRGMEVDTESIKGVSLLKQK